MSRRMILVAAAAAILAAAPAATLAQQPAAHVAAAVADEARPAEERARDADRKPAEMLAFAEVKPGQRVVDLIPGAGYFTRLFSKAVGSDGKVYAATSGPYAAQIQPVATNPAYGNVQVVDPPIAAPLPEPVDLIFTAQNYHDLHLAQLGIDVPAFNKALFEALKPGGLLVVVDHAAAPGAPLNVADSLHRIDPAAARRELEAAGFQFVAESNVLRNPADDHSKNVFDPAIRGKTDQFVYKFRKPG
jgi:predicted methyltransferase